MAIQDALRAALEALDVLAVRRLWRQASPHLPQPATDQEAIVSMHMARTAAQSMSPRLRYYSHAWLRDRGLPSQLPEVMQAPAERLYPRPDNTPVVGISVNSRYPEVTRRIRGVMEDAVKEAYADQRIDPEHVKRRMHEARMRERRGLGLTAGRA